MKDAERSRLGQWLPLRTLSGVEVSGGEAEVSGSEVEVSGGEVSGVEVSIKVVSTLLNHRAAARNGN